MAGVTNNESNVVLAGKIHSLNDMVTGRDVHSVVHIVAEEAWLGLGGEWIARLVSKVRLHHRRRGFKASDD